MTLGESRRDPQNAEVRVNLTHRLNNSQEIQFCRPMISIGNVDLKKLSDILDVT
jgi:hypothetical protein